MLYDVTKQAKYHEWRTNDGLLKIEAWSRDGLSNEQIANNIGITRKTLQEWLNKYSDIRDALKRGKEVVDIEVENALLRRALGYEYEEVKTFIEEVDGKKKKKIEKVTRHIPADMGAGIFWLKNRRSDKWSNKEELEKVKTQLEINKMRKELETEKSTEDKLSEYFKRLDGAFDE